MTHRVGVDTAAKDGTPMVWRECDRKGGMFKAPTNASATCPHCGETVEPPKGAQMGLFG